ncbi:hypothetical protein L9F63_012014 [Diploptera punctata]|uniref:CHK kinase-like domain-containing protein n=1 Tax=Diploptera punctata TaxID=6984 RepID=A0AAD8ADF0_DIPPU|nr:hypothetical protein L9F63_012014 [Diploptera punctata]
MTNRSNWNLQLPTNYLKEVVSDILEKEKFNPASTLCSVEKVSAGPWVSEIFRVKACDSNKHLTFFLKCLPQDVSKSELLCGNLLFKNEVIFYKKVVPAFEYFQKEKLPLDSPSFLSVPKCYRAETDGKNDFIIMEDVSNRGFVNEVNNKITYLPELFLIFKEIGHLHGLSLALKIQRPQYFKSVVNCIEETVFNQNFFEHMTKKIVTDFYEVILLHLKNHYEKDNIYLKKFENWKNSAVDMIPKLALGDSSNEPYNVITHGDPWVTNFMFHYKNGSDIPDAILSLDFQHAQYTSPATDVGRLLFVGMDKSTRYEHRDDLLHCYYRSMSQVIREFGSDPEIFPFSALESQLDKYSAFIIFNSLFAIVQCLNNYEHDETGYNGDGAENVLNSINRSYQKLTKYCFQRICEVIEECVDRGYM